ARAEQKKDVNELSVTETLTSTVAALSDKVELLLKRDVATTPVAAPPRLEACVTCGSTAHHWTVCPSTQPSPPDPTDSVNVAYGYYPQHPALSWRQPPPPQPQSATAPQPSTSSFMQPTPTPFEAMMLQSMAEQTKMLANLTETQQRVSVNTQAIAKLETQVGQLLSTINRREDGRPAQPPKKE
ncbi:hypothetical protein Dimus_006084, partial [Dionaea muscipula]